SKWYELLKMGYTAGITDCIMSFNRWQKLIAARMRNAVAVSLSSVVSTLRSVTELCLHSGLLFQDVYVLPGADLLEDLRPHADRYFTQVGLAQEQHQGPRLPDAAADGGRQF